MALGLAADAPQNTACRVNCPYFLRGHQFLCCRLFLTICACRTTCDTPFAGSRCTRGHVNPLQLAVPSCALPALPCSNDELLQRLLVFCDFQPLEVLRPRSNTSTGISLYELLRPSPQESVAPDSQEMRLFIRADAQLFTGAMQAMAPLDASSGFLMCFRSFARHRADVATPGALALGGFFA